MLLGTDDHGWFLPVSLRQTAATAAGATIWTMRNTSSTKAVMVKRIKLATVNDQATAPGLSVYELCRFFGVTPTGGTALTPIELRTSQVTTGGWASGITDARVLDTGLTMGAATFETAFAALRPGSSVSPTFLDVDFEDLKRKWPGFELSPGEGLCIRLTTAAAVIGNNLSGYVHWTERL